RDSALPLRRTCCTTTRCSSAFCPFARAPPTPSLFPYTTLFRSHSPDKVSQPKLARRFHQLLSELIELKPMPLWPESSSSISSERDRKSTRLNSSHVSISYAVFCLKKKKNQSPELHPT